MARPAIPGNDLAKAGGDFRDCPQPGATIAPGRHNLSLAKIDASLEHAEIDQDAGRRERAGSSRVQRVSL